MSVFEPEATPPDPTRADGASPNAQREGVGEQGGRGLPAPVGPSSFGSPVEPSGLGSDLRFGPGSSTFDLPEFEDVPGGSGGGSRGPVEGTGDHSAQEAATALPYSQAGPVSDANRGPRRAAVPWQRYIRLGLILIAVIVGVVRSRSGGDANGPFVTAGGKFQQGAEGLSYDNPAQHVHLMAPAGWKQVPDKEALVALTTAGCSDFLLEKNATGDLKEMNEEMFSYMQKDHPEIQRSVSSTMLAGRSSATFSVDYRRQDGDMAHQRIFAVRRGKTVFTLIETAIGDNACDASLAEIRSSLTL